MTRRRFLLGVHAVTAVAHLAPALAWSALVHWWLVAPAGLVLWGLTAWRVQHLLGDPVRPRWVVRLVDEPLFWHWGAGVIALPLLVLGSSLLAALSIGGCGVSGATAPPFAAVTLGSFGAALGLSAWGLWGRRRLVRVRRVEIEVPGLHPDLDGYRIAHLSDLHIGSYDPLERGLSWAKLASSLEPDLIAVTGDLVTSGTAHYSAAARVLGALRARDGVTVSMGNHDQWDDDALAAAIEAEGPRVLRNAWVSVRRGAGELVVAGIDDAYTEKHDLDATLADRPEGVPTVLLSHYPDFFADAAARGVELVLSGHTHGGQLGVPFVAERWNLARLLGQAGRGLYRRGKSALYVSAGLGTTGPPIRLGIPPEIALLVLRARPVV